MIEFIGKLHPLLVHLPIGMIIVGIFMEWMGEFKRFTILKSNTKYIFLIAMVVSILSLISGYILSLEEANDEGAVDVHKWFAFITSLFLLIQLIIWEQAIKFKILHHILLFILLLLISITGHLGGELTHGEGYLTNTIRKHEERINSIPPISDIQNAKVYEDVIYYILKEKCESCHGNERQKGKLRLDNIESILKGGKSGKVINLENYTESELIKRIHLDISDDHRMPPKKEKQLTVNEVQILEWWISNRCISNKTFASFSQDSAFKITLNNYSKARNTNSKPQKQSRLSVSPISESQKQNILHCGLIVSQISADDNHIRVTGFNLEKPLNEVLTSLNEVKLQLVELKLGNTQLKDDELKIISTYSSLEKLWIDHNVISDRSIENLIKLKKLSYLNIAGNQLTKDGIRKLLTSLPVIKTLIAIEIPISDQEIEYLKKEFKGVYISVGKDTMEIAPSDTLFSKKIRN